MKKEFSRTEQILAKMVFDLWISEGASEREANDYVMGHVLSGRMFSKYEDDSIYKSELKEEKLNKRGFSDIEQSLYISCFKTLRNHGYSIEAANESASNEVLKYRNNEN